MSVPGWSLAWSEEFDGDAGSTPDPGTWRMETGNGGWGDEELQYYTDSGENAFLDGGGNLAIVVRQPEPAVREDRYGGCGFTSARVISKGRMALRYGLVEARIRIPEGRGIWPAFWMLGQDIDEKGWPQCGEVDIMEILGQDPAVLHATVHGPGTRELAASILRAAPARAWWMASTCTPWPGSLAGSAGSSMASCTPR
jgi:beta-glucanase (GH16 family)